MEREQQLKLGPIFAFIAMICGLVLTYQLVVKDIFKKQQDSLNNIERRLDRIEKDKKDKEKEEEFRGLTSFAELAIRS